MVGKMHPEPRFTAKCTKFVDVAFLVASLITGYLHPALQEWGLNMALPALALSELSLETLEDS